MRSGLWFAGLCVLIAGAVGLLGGSLVADSERTGVWSGAGAASVFQVSAFWLLFVWGLPGRPLAAYLLGMLGRLLMVGLAALVWVPRAGLPPAPTLFALVAVFFATTLVESVYVQFQHTTTRR